MLIRTKTYLFLVKFITTVKASPTHETSEVEEPGFFWGFMASD